jgi:DNA invertase Pin-like site-specific DNA recombinase
VTRPAAYLRVSDPKQVEKFSLPSQQRLIADYCAYQGWPEPVFYSEDGHTAFLDDPYARPVFGRLLADVKARKVDVVIVIDLDRFARNTLAALLAKRDIEDNRARIVSLNQQMDFTTPDGELMFVVGSGFAHYYSKQLSRKVKAGNEQKRRKGLHVGGVPWAARRVAGLLEPIPDRLTVVRQVLELAAAHGLQTTAVILNERGIASPRGGMWSPPVVAYMVDDGGDWLRALGGPWPALVDAARANRRAPAVRRDRQVHTLSGLLYCCCGGRIHYSTGWRRPDGTLAHSLHCRNKDRPQIVACGRRRTRAEQYEAIVEDWFLHLPDLSRAWESADEGAPERARIAEARRRYKREYFERQRLSDQEYDALLADLDAQERALPPEPAALRAKAHGIAVAQGRWAEWLPPARNRFLRSILRGVLINGRCALPVPFEDVNRMVAVSGVQFA